MRKELFCDGRANCAWPNGDVPTDETQCDAEGNYVGDAGGLSSGGGGGGAFSPSNIPVIIVAVIVVVGALLVFLVAVKTFYKTIVRGREEASDEEGGNDRALEVAPPLLRHREGEDARGPPSAPPSADAAGRSFFPAAPPSYDDVIKASREAVNHDLPSSPPPYTSDV